MTLAESLDRGEINITVFSAEGKVVDIEVEHVGGNKILIETSILASLGFLFTPWSLRLGQFRLLFLRYCTGSSYIEYEIIADHSKKKELN